VFWRCACAPYEWSALALAALADYRASALLLEEEVLMPTDIKYYTIDDVSEMLQVGKNTVHLLKKKGLPFIKFGKVIRFDPDEVKAWLKANSESATGNE
jgi:excisionase family DNA binding protein